jgi:hypothetical protein
MVCRTMAYGQTAAVGMTFARAAATAVGGDPSFIRDSHLSCLPMSGPTRPRWLSGIS